MSDVRKRSVVAATATTAVAALLLGNASTASAAVPYASKAVPTITVTSNGKTFHVTGATKFRAGLVRIVLKASGQGAELALVNFHKGYSFAKYKSDTEKSGKLAQSDPKASLKVEQHIVNKTYFDGGVDAQPGKAVSMTVKLKKGKYFLYNNSTGPTQPHTLRATGSIVHRDGPKATATVKFKDGERFGGSTTLPAHGTLTVKNTATDSPHFLDLSRVKQGTTRKQVADYFASGAQGEPSWALPDYVGTDVITPGHQQTLHYSVRAGEYVELCFFTDLKTGMPHAFMGMFRIVQLKN